MPRLIDKDKLWKDILDLPNCYNGFSDCYDKAMIIDEIIAQPTVDAVPLEDYKSMEQTVNKLTKAIADAEPVRHGRWIETHEVLDYIKCSECGKDWCTVDNDTETFNYCPNCGAKMDEVRDE